MRRNLLLIFASVVIVSLMIGLLGCGGPAAPAPSPSPTASPKPTATSAPVPTSSPAPSPKPTVAPAPTAAPGKQIILSFALFSPAVGRAESLQWWAQEVEKRTNNRVKVNMYWSGSLMPGPEVFNGVRVGLADMGEVAPVWYTSQLPLSQLTQIPGISAEPGVVVKAWRDTINAIPQIEEEFIRFNQKLIIMGPTLENNVETVKPYRSLAEMKGVKVRVFGSAYPKLLQQVAGIVPVSILATETYEALLRGTVEGCIGTNEGAYRYKWFEVAPYMINFHLGASVTVLGTINLDTWNKIPSDIQKIMVDVGKEQEQVLVDIYAKQEAGLIKQMQDSKKGYTIIDLPPADLQAIRDASKPIAKEQAAAADAKGLPGSKLLDAYYAALAKYEAAAKK